jgi:hypothetical protein
MHGLQVQTNRRAARGRNSFVYSEPVRPLLGRLAESDRHRQRLVGNFLDR